MLKIEDEGGYIEVYCDKFGGGELELLVKKGDYAYFFLEKLKKSFSFHLKILSIF